jgi:hypothetical protein
MAADLHFPLHFLERAERLTILDGTHRLLKASLLGQTTLVIKRVPTELLDDIAAD